MRNEEGGVGPDHGFSQISGPTGLVGPDHGFSQIYWEIGHRLDPGTNHAHSDYPGHTFEGCPSSISVRV